MTLVWVEWNLPPLNDILKSKSPDGMNWHHLNMQGLILIYYLRFSDENFQYHNIVKYDINDHMILYHNCALFNFKNP